MGRQKDDIVRDICAAIGVPFIPLGPGSKEKKAVFEAIDRQLSLRLPADHGKQELAQAIVELGGVRWDGSCWSTGDTVTAVGLERVLAACRALKGGAVSDPVGSEPDDVGVPYQESSVRIDAAPTELLLDWESLDAATQEHADLQNSLAEHLRSAGLEPMSPRPDGPRFDIAWRGRDGSLFVCEVKSSTEVNRDQQLRLGLGQVLEYRFRLQRELSEPVKAVVAITQGGPVARGVCGAAGVRLIERSRLEEDLLEVFGGHSGDRPAPRPAPPPNRASEPDLGLSEQHRRALHWFAERAGSTTTWPEPLPDGTLLVCRPKGIYKPGWTDYALSVRQGMGGEYPDKDPEPRPGGGWRYRYYQESIDPQARDGEYTNKGLLNCMRDGVPVGVMRKVSDGAVPLYEVLGLAKVVGWEAGYFDLEGPIVMGGA